MVVSHPNAAARSPALLSGFLLQRPWRFLMARGLRFLGLVVLGGSLIGVGCDSERGTDTGGTSARGDGSKPTLDARGGETDSQVYPDERTPYEGTGGAGGSIRLTSSGGSITVTDAAPVTVAPPAFAGFGFDVFPGQTVEVSGSQTVSYLRVQAGGVLKLTGRTLFLVQADAGGDGNVEISGKIVSVNSEGSIDGKDLSIEADGVVHIAGTIDLSGFSEDEGDPVDKHYIAGGHGGELYIASLTTPSVASPGPHVYVGGQIKANGGDSFSQNPETARAGDGGRVFLGSAGYVSINGPISARGGLSYFGSGGTEGAGGTIQIVALRDIEVNGAHEVNANGGNSSGTAGGKGGSIMFEAPTGGLILRQFDMECRGGLTTYSDSGRGGDGGVVTLTATGVVISDMYLNVSGGDTTRDETGIGGTGGTAQIAGSSTINVDEDVTIDAEGGKTRLSAWPGGTGGNIKLINIDQDNLDVMDFLGRALVSGGSDAIGGSGPDGTICVAGSNPGSDAALTGGNAYPISICSNADLEGFVIHDIDCDDSTIMPGEVSTSLPVVIGVDFYRIFITQEMIDEGITALSVSTTGSDDGNLDLFVGSAGALGSFDPADYTYSSTEPTSTEKLEDIDISGLSAGSFLAVMVAEQNTFVEDYTITVTCAAD